MYHVYVLKSKKDGMLYTGHTEDLDKRLVEHNSGKVRSTAPRRPFSLLFSQAHATRSEARWRERYLKTASGKKWLKSHLQSI